MLWKIISPLLSLVFRLSENKKTLLPAVAAIALGVHLCASGKIEEGVAAIVAGWGLLSEGQRE